MTMRKYIVTIHEDGHITANEYEEPKGFVYCVSDADSDVVCSAYNQALQDVTAVLDAEKSRCEANGRIDKFGHGWSVNWAGRAIECEILKTSIKNLFRKS